MYEEKKMKKIGIMTFHKAHNYGAVLQAYALKKTIESLGYEVGFVDIQHKCIAEGYKIFPSVCITNPMFTLKGYVHLLLDPFRKVKRRKGFDGFIRNNFDLISLCHGEVLVDTVVLGSDQIWNLEYTNGFVDFHFGKITGLKSKKIISYAASMGKTVLDMEQKRELYNYVEDINVLGVREQSLQKLLRDEFNLTSALNLDPTLLLERDEWNGITSSLPIESDDYILVYEVEPNSLKDYAVKEVCKKMGLKVVYLAAKTNFKIPRTHISDASPEQFLYLFANAKFVITTSFHGTVFSIINNVPFLTLGFGSDIDTRSLSILEILNLKQRIVFSESDIALVINSLDVCFDTANKLLRELKKSSIDFLKLNLD